MENKACIIRQQHFAYNDEFYLRDEAFLPQIHAVYTDRESAHLACKQLNLEVLPREILGNYFAPEYQQADIELLQQLNQFCLEHCGQSLFDERGRHEDYIPAALSPDDYFEFAQRANMLRYIVIEVSSDCLFYLLWMNEEQAYFDGLQGYLIESRHPDFSEYDWSELIYAFELLLEDKLRLHAPEMLTNQSKLWEALLSSISAFELDTQRRITAIDIEQLTFTQLSAINSLLKTPIFEIRTLSLQQLQEIYSL
ncbi:hypothetical protein [Acinetobacter sp.]|uniref:hypothetical protein n=1 Tax=Acinetobacter sp. TaxID=472 RepID=UPI002FCBCC7F